MKKGILIGLCLTALALSGCKLTTYNDQSGGYIARLTGEEEVPAISTKAHGQFVAELLENGKDMHFELTVGQIEGLTSAHIHLGKPGESGPPIVTLYPGPVKDGEFNGTLAEGVFSEAAFTKPFDKKSMADLITEMRRGNTYVNVHTQKTPRRRTPRPNKIMCQA